MQTSTLKFDESGQPLHLQQTEQINAFREAWREAGHQREPRVSVSRSIFALVDDRDRAYFGHARQETDQIGYLDETTRAIFGRTYAAEPDVLVEQLAEDTAIAAADTLLLTVPEPAGRRLQRARHREHPDPRGARPRLALNPWPAAGGAPRRGRMSAMARFQHKRLDQPDEVRPYPLGQTEIFELDDFVVGRMVMEPGWRWTHDVRPIAGTERCMYHHLGYCISGALNIELEDGTTGVIKAGEMFELPPGHEAWVEEGTEPWIAVDFRGARSYARPLAASADRILATVLFTDIVDSTEQLRRMGDTAWRDVVGQHNELVKFELDRYRGRLIKQTGDGVIALFDGAARAVECAGRLRRR